MRRFTITPERFADGRVVFDRAESRHLARVLRLRPATRSSPPTAPAATTPCVSRRSAMQATGTVLALAARDAESPSRSRSCRRFPRATRWSRSFAPPRSWAWRASSRRSRAHGDPARARPLARARAALAARRAGGGEAMRPRRGPDRRDAAAARRRSRRDEPADLRLCLWEGAPGARRRLALALAASSPRRRRFGRSAGGRPGPGKSRARWRPAGGRSSALGPRILRTETAGPAIIAILQARFGDLGRGPDERAPAGSTSRRGRRGRARLGATRADAFAQAALGVFALIVRPEEVAERERARCGRRAITRRRCWSQLDQRVSLRARDRGLRRARVEVTPAPTRSSTACCTAKSWTSGAIASGTMVKAATLTGSTVGRDRRAGTRSA